MVHGMVARAVARVPRMVARVLWVVARAVARVHRVVARVIGVFARVLLCGCYGTRGGC